MDIRDWLKSLGLGQYETKFRENEISDEVLPDLTEADLEKIGVPLGHRKRLLKAIANLSAAEIAARPTSPSPAPLSIDSAERRQLTVMFCDLVGSTALSARLDPEDMREVIRVYQDACSGAIARYDGFIAKYMGDGVLAYFGYPEAHEHDAERAVRSALAIVEAAPKLATAAGSPLNVRVGIATGLVVVGDLIGSGEAQERGIVGETPNLAARLQGIAEPNAVVIAESTRRLLGNLFELEDLGARDLKGIARPSRAWTALRPSSVESRFEALHATGLTALVGREEESELLLRRWSRAKTGEGQVVLLCGEAGIGKSRLTAALLERLTSNPHTRLRYFCSPHHTDSAFYPIIGQMERAAGLAHDDSLQTRLDKLDAVLGQASTSNEDAALIAEMLSLPNDGRYPALELAPQERRQRTLEALISQLEALTRRNPVLMIFEDAHWIDPTSLEVLGRAVNRIATIRVLLIVTFRPEFDPPWIGQPHVTALTINRLAQREVADMIDRVVGNKLLPASTRQDIVERTDGIPLFVEEMTKAVLEAESEGAARRTVAAIPPPDLAVPASLHASLMARLDRLGTAKEVAQIGAAIGREFSHALLAAVAPNAGEDLGSALNRLIRAGLLFRQGVPPHATYLFKHALVRDAAYSTLLREPRRALHARIAAALESRFGETTESRPEILAHHCTEAGLTEKAAGLWGKAGQQSLARSALVEAVAQLTKALDQLANLPETTAIRREKLKLQVSLASGLMLVKGYSSPDVIGAFEKARSMIENAESLRERPEDPLLHFSILYGLWVASYIAMDVDRLCRRAEEFLALAARAEISAPLQIGHRLMAVTQLVQGRFDMSQTHADQAVALYAPQQHRQLATRFGHDVGATALAYQAWALWFRGYPQSALAVTDQLINHARDLGHAATLMHALFHVAYVEDWARQVEAAETHAAELIALAAEKGAEFWRALGMLARGSILSATDRAADAIELMNAGAEAYRSTGSKVMVPTYLTALARSYARTRQLDRASEIISQALETVDETNERTSEAETHRKAGELALLSAPPDVERAEASFQRGLAIARQQGARSFELRTATSLARLWRDQGKSADARNLLAPIYGWFTEGFDLPDLKDAKAQLDELSGGSYL
jgi:class 3 adenylate cyclase/predicted ATPase